MIERVNIGNLFDGNYIRTMKITSKIILMTCIVIVSAGSVVLGQESTVQKNTTMENSPDLLENVLDLMEQRYSTPGFSASFKQKSTLTAMDITDTASGTIIVKRPGMMRWEYHTPDRQIIITDGEQLWIYRPDEYQVMVGKAPAFFKDGKGAGFLSDMRMLREKFTISWAEAKLANDENYHLKLLPVDKRLELKTIYLAVDPQTYVIKNIVTYNTYDDKTQIWLTDYNFQINPDDAAFRFIIPEGIDVLELE